jgi:hypothetical protein
MFKASGWSLSSQSRVVSSSDQIEIELLGGSITGDGKGSKSLVFRNLEQLET